MTFRPLLLLLPVAAAAGEPPSRPSQAQIEERSVRGSPIETSEVWVTLVPSSGDIKQQQDTVMSQLRALGATERARVVHARNALAVSIDPAKLDEARRIPGVRSIAPVQHVEREPRPVPPPAR